MRIQKADELQLTLELYNRFNFTSLKSIKMMYEENGMKQISDLPDILPHCKGQMVIKVRGNSNELMAQFMKDTSIIEISHFDFKNQKTIIPCFPPDILKLLRKKIKHR